MAVIVVKCCVVFAKYYIFYHVIFMPSSYWCRGTIFLCPGCGVCKWCIHVLCLHLICKFEIPPDFNIFVFCTTVWVWDPCFRLANIQGWRALFKPFVLYPALCLLHYYSIVCIHPVRNVGEGGTHCACVIAHSPNHTNCFQDVKAVFRPFIWFGCSR